MTSRPGRHTLTAEMREWDAERIAALLRRRPDLVDPEPPSNIEQLAQWAQQFPSVSTAIDAATLAEDRLLQLIVCCRPDVPGDELAAALPDDVTPADIEPVLASLEQAALIWRHGGRVHSSGTLRQAMPTTLGPPLRALATDQTVEYLKAVIGNLRAVAEREGEIVARLPPMATGPNGRPPRKAELVDELEELLVTPGLVAEVLATATPDARQLAETMSGGQPFVGMPFNLYYSPYSSSSWYRDDAIYQLYIHGLLLPSRDRAGSAAQPREVGVALRCGKPIADLALTKPDLGTSPVDPQTVDAEAAAAARRTLGRVADLIDRWTATPAKALKNGGLGVAVVKESAAALDLDIAETERLIETAYLAGLIDERVESRVEKRKHVHEASVAPSPVATRWLEQPEAERWRQLTRAWLRAEYWPSAAGRQPDDAKAVPLLKPQWGARDAPDLRRRVLDALAGIEPGTATTPGAVAEWVYWARPRPWLTTSAGDWRTAIGWVYGEAEMLGLVAHGALSAFGRALLDGDDRTAVALIDAALPQASTTFTLQADLTATVVGDLDRGILTELRLLADVESTGAGTTFRFSDASLRRAIDAGRDAETIVSFLGDHASKGVPQPLAYLVHDVARRHGHLLVGEAASFVTSDDPAVLADACAHRRTRKLGLRLIAPTVAVSSSQPATVLDTLREAGFLPASADDAEGAPPRDAGRESTEAAVSGSGDGLTDGAANVIALHSGGHVAEHRDSDDALPERFRQRSWPGHSRRRDLAAVDGPTATALAAAILAGPQPASSRIAADRDATNPYDTSDADDIGTTLARAASEGRVVSVAIGDETYTAEPMLLTIAYIEGNQIVGLDIDDGTTVSLLREHIGRVTDVGPIDEFIDAIESIGSFGQDSRPPRRARRRSKRGRRR
jgi:hypothetical protein